MRSLTNRTDPIDSIDGWSLMTVGKRLCRLVSTGDYWVKVPALVVPTPGQQEVSALLVRSAFTLHLP